MWNEIHVVIVVHTYGGKSFFLEGFTYTNKTTCEERITYFHDWVNLCLKDNAFVCLVFDISLKNRLVFAECFSWLRFACA